MSYSILENFSIPSHDELLHHLFGMPVTTGERAVQCMIIQASLDHHRALFPAFQYCIAESGPDIEGPWDKATPSSLIATWH